MTDEKSLTVYPGFKFDIRSAKDPRGTSAQLPFNDLCQDTDEEQEAQHFAQYEIADTRRICWRVVCVNEVAGRKFNYSLIGPTGHLERMNVWTHLAAAGLYFVYAATRPVVYGSYRASTTNELTTAAAAALVATYLISSAYHVASANRFWSAVWRIGDYGVCFRGRTRKASTITHSFVRGVICNGRAFTLV